MPVGVLGVGMDNFTAHRCRFRVLDLLVINSGEHLCSESSVERSSSGGLVHLVPGIGFSSSVAY